ncbi:MAG: aspartate carbamoyltransferase catalytic subunit [Bacteroidota bacterium]|nr:aspartate carbamoyltransferase catalytic subunit [Candidatus Kapabacteria bacterium]MCS7302018.1 aspartate carbamoyltransferase catalytic subunit [Candidatus Kapabacteria bacterium]MCX7936818.1 aspartate carbamoyltransferase catalytic subunit [Chlorobiota bacterium]MDW8074537.1 aspartate carbamoyltransferase catalytic subunit [Bacteroidota bacterium]MDW8270987.1 aspartate carbamoyltransferase catalytic subunit [Bacteroidota bacterium]
MAQRHFIGIEQAGAERCHQILKLAQLFRQSCRQSLDFHHRLVVLAFFEPSTRTRNSFEAAAVRLGFNVIHFSAVGSSIEKGESVEDTIRTLEAIGANAIVVRHQASDAAEIASRVAQRASIINAGDGTHEHPTQALLDAMTLIDVWGTLEGKRVAIVGDILHSRVFRSNYALLRMLGCQIGVCAPPLLMPRWLPPDIVILSDIRAALAWADAVISLRLQRERMDSGLVPSLSDYCSRYAVREQDFQHSRAYLLHPGPVNWGIEIEHALQGHPRNLILHQVENGVFIRMAVLVDVVAPEVVQSLIGRPCHGEQTFTQSSS